MKAFVLTFEDVSKESEKAYQVLSLDASRKTIVIPKRLAEKKGLLECKEDRLSQIGSLPDWLY